MQSVYQSVYTLFLLLREEVLGKDILIQESKDNTYDEQKLHLSDNQAMDNFK
ncbi:hypothetical protein BSPWISOXPB_224 [uncultured Gammaproteobacteria bacterium]|nr:hypothetical protein BSPWISOXPB_224 [uncultured Gammaproteobacteria bacterium]